MCDVSSDVYSVGVIAWEMLSGRAAEAGPLQPLSEIAAGVPAELMSLVEAMTATRQEDRPSGDTVRRTVSPWITAPPPAPEQLWRPLPPRRRRRGPIVAAAVLAVVLLVGSLVLWRSTTGLPPLTNLAPVDAAFRLDLEDDWVATPDGAESGIVTAASEQRRMVLTVAPIGAATPASAVQLLTASDDGTQVLESAELPRPEGSKESEDRRLVRYLDAGGNEASTLFVGRSCGTLALSIFSSDGAFDDDDRRYVTEVGERLALIDGPTVPQVGQDTPVDLRDQTAGGVRLSLPNSWVLIDDPASCLTAIDADPSGGQYVAVTFWPAAEPSAVLHQFETSWQAQGAEVAAAEFDGGILRRQVNSEGSEAVVYFVAEAGGSYAIRFDDLDPVPLGADDLATFDRIVGSFQVVS
ncbi:MAG: hypothetical protein ACK5PP_15335 [Acidimicrobiales bacterium]